MAIIFFFCELEFLKNINYYYFEGRWAPRQPLKGQEPTNLFMCPVNAQPGLVASKQLVCLPELSPSASRAAIKMALGVKGNQNKPPDGLDCLANTRAGLKPAPLVQDFPWELKAHISPHIQYLNSGCDGTTVVGELLLVSRPNFGNEIQNCDTKLKGIGYFLGL